MGGNRTRNQTEKPRKSLNVEEGHCSAVIHSSLKNFETQKSTNLAKKSSNISNKSSNISKNRKSRVIYQSNLSKRPGSVYRQIQTKNRRRLVPGRRRKKEEG